MIAEGIPSVHSALTFVMNGLFICWGCSQIFKLFHPVRGFIAYFYVVFRTWICYLVFSAFTSIPISLPEPNTASFFFFVVWVLLWNILTLSACVIEFHALLVCLNPGNGILKESWNVMAIHSLFQTVLLHLHMYMYMWSHDLMCAWKLHWWRYKSFECKGKSKVNCDPKQKEVDFFHD